jgi:LmbE family N-acetylglucosaminyl deacetylase
MPLVTTGPSIFLQPHYDDVPLSCGGTVAMLARAGHNPHMVTVCASEFIPRELNPFATWKHERWGLTDPEQVVRVRRMEDFAAARTLGCTVRWLEIPDAIYRDNYTSDAKLFGPLAEEEHELVADIADDIQSLPEWQGNSRVFVPLGIGMHVDHQLVFKVGQTLAARGTEVYAYEDCPYAIHTPEGRERRLTALGSQVGRTLLTPIGEMIERRLDAIACYTSQLPVIFRFTQDFRSTVLDFARCVGGGQPAERFWLVH